MTPTGPDTPSAFTGTLAALTAIGILILALAPLSIPFLALTVVFLAPLALPLLLVVPVALSAFGVRAVRRRVARRGEGAPAPRSSTQSGQAPVPAHAPSRVESHGHRERSRGGSSGIPRAPRSPGRPLAGQRPR
jgi:hypothetical protein